VKHAAGLTPLLADAARFARHTPGDRWFVDETYVKVNGVWRYVYRAIDQYGQVIDVLLTARRDAAAARRFFTRAPRTLKVIPSEVVTDAAPVYPAVLDQLLPTAWHHVEQYANNPIEADHSQLKRRLRPMRGLQTDRTAQIVIVGHAFLQNLRRGHYELGGDAPPATRLAAALTEPCGGGRRSLPSDRSERTRRRRGSLGWWWRRAPCSRSASCGWRHR
jgi:transposase-like protein